MRHLSILRYLDIVARTGSIRKAADSLSITSSALNRRIQDFEEELGTPIFERVSRGVRLNEFGELVVRYSRRQLADMEKLRSRLADLRNVRRGHVSIACSQAVASTFLPKEIAAYRRDFESITFSVAVLNHAQAQQALVEFTADLVLLFQPDRLRPQLDVLFERDEPLYAIGARDHPALQSSVVRLGVCMQYPIALPGHRYGARELLDASALHNNLVMEPVVESNSFEFLRNYVLCEPAITFQSLIGTPIDDVDHLAMRPIDARDVRPGRLILGQLRDRTLTVAAAEFAIRLEGSLSTSHMEGAQ